MDKKTWIDKREGLIKLKKNAENNKKMAIDDIEDLDFLISCYDEKIKEM